MKKSVIAVAVVGALGVTAHAATVSEFANGVLIPRVIDDTVNDRQTAIGLTSCAGGTVYWSFFDVNSKHVLDDEFAVTAEDQTNLVWNVSENPGGSAGELFGGAGVEDLEGYLIFVLDTTGDAQLSASVGNSDMPCLAGSAFEIDVPNDDVSVIPALPLDIRPIGVGDFLDTDGDGFYADENSSNNLVILNEVNVAGLNAGANGGDTIYLRYFLDNAETDIYIWSAQDLSGSYPTNMYDDNQNRRSITIELPNAELNTIDPRGIIGRPSSFVDGFIRFDVPLCSGDEGGSPAVIDCPTGGSEDLVRGVFSWSVLRGTSASPFQAAQTIINPIKLRGVSGFDGGVSAFRARVVEDADDVVPGHSLENVGGFAD